MAKKSLYSPGEFLYSEGAPLVITSAVMSAARGGRREITLTVGIIGDRPVASADAVITADGFALPAASALVGDDGSPLTDGAAVSIQIDRTASEFEVGLNHIIYSDGEELRFPEVWAPLKCRIPLLEGLNSDRDLADEYCAQYGNDCKYLPADDCGVWSCTCGKLNYLSNDRCLRCRRKYSAFRSININALKEESQRHAAVSDGYSEREAAREERARQRARKKEENRRHRQMRLTEAALLKDDLKSAGGKIIRQRSSKQTEGHRKSLSILPFVLVPVLLVAVVLTATVPGFIKNKNAYAEAASLLEAQRYSEASAAFKELGSYSDSSDQYEHKVPYSEADYIFKCAEDGNSAALVLIGKNAAMFESTEHMRIALYEAAAVRFEKLGDYSDSAEKAVRCRDSIAAIELKFLQDAYDEALAMLDEGRYNEAKAAFAVLGDFSNSREMITECDYRKACVLLEYCERYNVRGIYAFISTELGMDNILSISTAATVRIGSTAAAVFDELLAADGTEIRHEDEHDDALVPICDAVNALFEGIADYKDSSKLASRALEAGDFTKPFYEYCSDGNIEAALNWLNEYDGEFARRSYWTKTIKQYLKFCAEWYFSEGDSSIVPYTKGVDIAAKYLYSAISLRNDKAYLRLFYNNEGDYVELAADIGNEQFWFYGDDYTFIAQLYKEQNLTYLKYGDDGLLSSAAYTPG